MAFSDGLPADARAEIEALLDGLGAHPVVPEGTLEAYAILAAMGPTYFWFQWQALRELGSTRSSREPDEGTRNGRHPRATDSL